MELKDKKCDPSSGQVSPLTLEEKLRLLKALGGEWKLCHEGKRIEKNFVFRNFKEALIFTNEVGRISEEEKHHPEIHLGWGYCIIEIWTHSKNDLLENDFILAAKITEAYQRHL